MSTWKDHSHYQENWSENLLNIPHWGKGIILSHGPLIRKIPNTTMAMAPLTCYQYIIVTGASIRLSCELGLYELPSILSFFYISWIYSPFVILFADLDPVSIHSSAFASSGFNPDPVVWLGSTSRRPQKAFLIWFPQTFLCISSLLHSS